MSRKLARPQEPCAEIEGKAVTTTASAQLLAVIDATIMNAARPHIHRALGFSGDGLRRDALARSGVVWPAVGRNSHTGVAR